VRCAGAEHVESGLKDEANGAADAPADAAGRREDESTAMELVGDYGDTFGDFEFDESW